MTCLAVEVPMKNGGANRIRTCDLLIANETLYQLSYDPTKSNAEMFATNDHAVQPQTSPQRVAANTFA
jgi:hypothetical protein